MLKGSLSFNANNAPKTPISLVEVVCPIAQHDAIYDAIWYDFKLV